MFDYILFDLDGTLTDPGEGITNSVAHALAKYGIDVPDHRELYKFIGPPLRDSFEKYYGIGGDESMRAVEYYREYFSVKGLYENRVYDGVREMLEALVRAGKHVVLATSKPDKFSKEIVRYFDLAKYFDFLSCATMDEKRTKKADVIAYAMESLKIDRARAVMIGDRGVDMSGAKENGLYAVGVTYGYGSREELIASGADALADSPEEILKLI